ncbi:unnamed protein product [Gadus morhua 'NCC']
MNKAKGKAGGDPLPAKGYPFISESEFILLCSLIRANEAEVLVVERDRRAGVRGQDRGRQNFANMTTINGFASDGTHQGHQSTKKSATVPRYYSLPMGLKPEHARHNEQRPDAGSIAVRLGTVAVVTKTGVGRLSFCYTR